MYEAAASLNKLAHEENVHPASLAIAWVIHHSTKPRPIISAKSIEQLEPSILGTELKLSDFLYEMLSKLTPKPAPATDRLEEA